MFIEKDSLYIWQGDFTMPKNLATSAWCEFYNGLHFGWVWFQAIGCVSVSQKC